MMLSSKTKAVTVVREKTCCFTGHRHIPFDCRAAIEEQLEAVVRTLIDEGFVYFGTGGAVGFDTMAAMTVLRLKAEFPHIRLIVVQPCKDQAAGWGAADRERYDEILRRADKVVSMFDTYQTGCMQVRNRHLIDHSRVCVCYQTSDDGGTAYTVEYARKKGVHILSI